MNASTNFLSSCKAVILIFLIPLSQCLVQAWYMLQNISTDKEAVEQYTNLYTNLIRLFFL